MRHYSTVRELHDAYRKGEITPLVYTTWLIERAESDEFERGTFTAILKERALSEASASTARYNAGNPIGLFDGVPIVWKDLFDIKGEITTGSSLAYLDAEPSKFDAPAVAFYSEQGGINLAKVGLSELAYSGLGINPGMGTPSNPASHTEKRIPGGSSSGTAVAVKKGLVSVGMGTDTSGSIRIPASFQGLYGYKPSRDFYHNSAGIMPLSTTLDSYGPIAESLQDCFDLYSLFNEKSLTALSDLALENTLSAESSQAYRYIVPINILPALDLEVRALFETTMEILEDQGLNIEWIEVPEIDAVSELTNQYGTFASAEASFTHRERLNDERRALIHPRVLSRMSRGDSMSAVDYVALTHGRSRLLEVMKTQYHNALFLMPTTPMEAPLLAPLEADDELFHTTNLRSMSLTVAGNFLAWDSITMPMGLGHHDMPLGLMLSSVDQNVERLFSECYKIDAMISGK